MSRIRPHKTTGQSVGHRQRRADAANEPVKIATIAITVAVRTKPSPGCALGLLLQGNKNPNSAVAQPTILISGFRFGRGDSFEQLIEHWVRELLKR